MFSFQLKSIPKMSLIMETSIPKVTPTYSKKPNNIGVFISYGNLNSKFRPGFLKKSMIQIVNEPFHTCGGCK